jgi:hypothetical protein
MGKRDGYQAIAKFDENRRLRDVKCRCAGSLFGGKVSDGGGL